MLVPVVNSKYSALARAGQGYSVNFLFGQAKPENPEIVT
jgi:hypothetical protein